jgi:hypothetical protein
MPPPCECHERVFSNELNSAKPAIAGWSAESIVHASTLPWVCAFFKTVDFPKTVHFQVQ